MAPPLARARGVELFLSVLLVTVRVPEPLKIAPPAPAKGLCCENGTVEFWVKVQLITLTVPDDALLMAAPPFSPILPVANCPSLIVRPRNVTIPDAVTLKMR